MLAAARQCKTPFAGRGDIEDLDPVQAPRQLLVGMDVMGRTFADAAAFDPDPLKPPIAVLGQSDRGRRAQDRIAAKEDIAGVQIDAISWARARMYCAGQFGFGERGGDGNGRGGKVAAVDHVVGDRYVRSIGDKDTVAEISADLIAIDADVRTMNVGLDRAIVVRPARCPCRCHPVSLDGDVIASEGEMHPAAFCIDTAIPRDRAVATGGSGYYVAMRLTFTVIVRAREFLRPEECDAVCAAINAVSNDPVRPRRDVRIDGARMTIEAPIGVCGFSNDMDSEQSPAKPPLGFVRRQRHHITFDQIPGAVGKVKPDTVPAIG